MSRDWNPLAPVRYKLGLTSGHIFDGRCQREEADCIKAIFERKYNPKGERRTAIVLQDIDHRKITRSDKLCWFLEMGREVMIHNCAVMPITFGLEGGSEIKVWVDLETQRSLVDTFIPRRNVQSKHIDPPKTSTNRPVYFSEPKREDHSLIAKWGQNISFNCFCWDGEYHRLACFGVAIKNIIYIIDQENNNA